MNEIIINNVDFFYMIDNQVRETMAKYESENLLPKAEDILKGKPRLIKLL